MSKPSLSMFRFFTTTTFLLTTLLLHDALGQDRTKAEQYVMDQEQAKKAAMMRELDSGVFFLDNGAYAEAEKKFLFVLENIKSVPSDLTYYFGKNSFHLGKYKQSIDWLTKYIQLKGTNGQFSEDAIKVKRLAETEFLKEKSKEAEKASEVLSTNYDIDCGATGKVVCPVCKGDHVIIKKGPFGDQYKTCVYCNEHGILTCEEYNQLLRGELKAKF